MGNQESSLGPGDRLNAKLEQRKAEIDYAKYFSALSTGAILLLIAFIKDVFPEPTGVNFLLASLSSFGAAVLSSIVLFTGTLLDHWDVRLGPGGGAGWGDKAMYLGMGAMWFFFFSGLITLLVFAFQNILKG